MRYGLDTAERALRKHRRIFHDFSPYPIYLHHSFLIQHHLVIARRRPMSFISGAHLRISMTLACLLNTTLATIPIYVLDT